MLDSANYHYHYSQVQAEIDVINASWNVGGTSNGLADSVGIMVYEGTQALQYVPIEIDGRPDTLYLMCGRYVDNFAHGSSQWEGFPITVDVASEAILLGCKVELSTDLLLVVWPQY